MNNISIYNKPSEPINLTKSEVQQRSKPVNTLKQAQKLAGWSYSRISATERLGDKITCDDHNSYCKQDCNNSREYPKNKKHLCINECENEFTLCKDNPDKSPAEIATMDVYNKYTAICNQINNDCKQICKYSYDRKVCNTKCTTNYNKCRTEARKIIQ